MIATSLFRYKNLRLETGYGCHEILLGGLVVNETKSRLMAFVLDPNWDPEQGDGQRRYLIYSQWNDFTGALIGQPVAYCLESDIKGLAQ